jgi:hypothetical protein
MQIFDQTQESILMEGMTPEQKLRFQQEMAIERLRNPKTASRLALWLGGTGAHHFYLGKRKRGWMYLLFIWTGTPILLAFRDSWGMRKRIQAMNSDPAVKLTNWVKSGGDRPNFMTPTRLSLPMLMIGGALLGLAALGTVSCTIFNHEPDSVSHSSDDAVVIQTGVQPASHKTVSVDDVEATIARLKAIPPKDQFESTADYESRLAKAADSTKVYHFLYKLSPGPLNGLLGPEMFYNADRQTASFGYGWQNPDFAYIVIRGEDEYGIALSQDSKRFLEQKFSIQGMQPEVAKRIWENVGLIIGGTSTGRIATTSEKFQLMDFEIKEVKLVVIDSGEVLDQKTRTPTAER